MVIVLDNTGSVARDHLANERTFLAWLRTSVNLMGIGIAFISFNIFTNGIVFIVLGLIFVIFSLFRYLQITSLLQEDKFIINKVCPK